MFVCATFLAQFGPSAREKGEIIIIFFFKKYIYKINIIIL